MIKFLKDETVTKGDSYKSHVVSVATGEPANSTSKPAPKRKAVAPRPITQGKLLRKGGPSTDVSKCVPSARRPLNLSLDRNPNRPPSRSHKLKHCPASPHQPRPLSLPDRVYLLHHPLHQPQGLLNRRNQCIKHYSTLKGKKASCPYKRTISLKSWKKMIMVRGNNCPAFHFLNLT